VSSSLRRDSGVDRSPPVHVPGSCSPLRTQLDYLRLESSLTAEPFYQALGYRIEARGELMIASGVPMAAITMSKRIADDRRRTDD